MTHQKAKSKKGNHLEPEVLPTLYHFIQCSTTDPLRSLNQFMGLYKILSNVWENQIQTDSGYLTPGSYP